MRRGHAGRLGGTTTSSAGGAFRVYPADGDRSPTSKVGNILDSNPGTGWQSRWLSIPNYPVGQEVGISLDLGTAKKVATVQLNLPAAESVRVLVGNSPTPTGARRIDLHDDGTVSTELLWLPAASPAVS